MNSRVEQGNCQAVITAMKRQRIGRRCKSSSARHNPKRPRRYNSYMPFLDYDLPSRLIAQHPAEPRDSSRLLLTDRTSGRIEHRQFRDLPEILRPGDLLVLNDTRVVPARLVGARERTGGHWEALFLREATPGVWELMAQTRGTLLPGEWIRVEPGPLRLELIEKTAEGHWLVRPDRDGSPFDLLSDHGRMPLPPYIRKGQAEPEDAGRYQTVFARQPGAIAAPTAGLHFTPELLERLLDRRIACEHVTLHVGAGTFQPIRTQDFREHVMHREWGQLTESAADAIAAAKASGRRIIAVGTTSVRVLETVAATGPVRAWSGETGLFIYPPYHFGMVDALITNFHLPKSTLLLLVGAFAGEELIREAYRAAIEREYRFFSYGDAMLIQ
jgi:S-adenosylmethionine:tRNA ribosyltransferase-isomerase